jgi:hypothetical protein
MKNQDYHTILSVDATPQEAFKSINSVTKWWTEYLEGSSKKIDDVFTVRFDDIHVSTQKIVELIPDKKIVWLVTDSKLTFVENQHEWTNTKISFELSIVNNKTQIHFTHYGLSPNVQCYNGCTQGWDYYIKESLLKLLTEGKGTPELK